MKVSIIVPVYNSEEYLEKCLESLVNQTLKNIEIIVIDDCSTDKSKEIINNYCKEYYGKVSGIFLEKNNMQGFARNIGLEHSTGEYVLFVDSDDYIDINACEILYDRAKEENYDIVCFDIIEVRKDKKYIKKLAYDSSFSGRIDSKKREFLLDSKGYFSTRMYKKEMLISKNIKFPEGIHYEDSAFNTITLLYAENIAKVDKGLYFYFIREGSSSNCYNEERLYDRITTVEYMFKQVKERGIYIENKNIIDKKYLKMTVGNIHLCLDMFNKPNLKKLEEISMNLKKNIINYENLDEYRNLDKISKLYLKINTISPKLLLFIDNIYKSILKKLN